MKKLGVIGGLGPLASAYFLQLLTEMTDAKIDQEHIEIFLHSKPAIPDRTNFILNKSDKNPLPELLEAGKGLVEQGADIIAIPCITAHYFHSQLSKLKKPVIHTIEETGIYLEKEGIKTVGIMATDGTIESNLFQNKLNQKGIKSLVPDSEGQSKVMHIIYENVKSGREIDIDMFLDVKKELFDKGAEVILLGCTELSIAKKNCNVGKNVLDVMEVLARKSVLECAKLKEEYNKLITV